MVLSAKINGLALLATVLHSLSSLDRQARTEIVSELAAVDAVNDQLLFRRNAAILVILSQSESQNKLMLLKAKTTIVSFI